MSSRKPVEPQTERRGHPELKHNAKLAEQFGITPGADRPRELVKVAHIPTPPPEVDQLSSPEEEAMVAGDAVSNVVREEVEELGTRLKRFGINFNPSQQQTVVDYTMSVLAGFGGGGALARRQ
jgi:hypothetical protein